MGAVVAALTALLATWVVAPGDARAERIVLKSGEVVEGSIIDATRNTVIVQRSIGGMRQMPIQDIGEVQFDLAQGQQIAGQFLGWADGVYEIGSGDEVVRVSEGGVVGREPRQQTARLLSTRPSSRQQGTAAAAPAPARAEPSSEPMAAPASAGQNRNRAAADAGSDGAAAGAQRAAADAPERRASDSGAQAAADQASDTEEQVAAGPGSKEAGPGDGRYADTGCGRGGEPGWIASARLQPALEARRAGLRHSPWPVRRHGLRRLRTRLLPIARARLRSALEARRADQAQPMAGTQTRVAAAENQAAADRQSQAGADRQRQAAVGEEHAALGEQGTLAVKASVDPPEPGARSMVFNIELSRPAEQTLVLIYGTVDGTAKAGEDYEAKQGMVTLAPGATTAKCACR